MLPILQVRHSLDQDEARARFYEVVAANEAAIGKALRKGKRAFAAFMQRLFAEPAADPSTSRS